LVDTRDLKSLAHKACGFDSRPAHQAENAKKTDLVDRSFFGCLICDLPNSGWLCRGIHWSPMSERGVESWRGNSNAFRGLGVAALAGSLVLIGVAADRGLTQYQSENHTYSGDEPQVLCFGVDAVHRDTDSVDLVPLVRALGKVPYAHLYTMVASGYNNDPLTGDIANAGQRGREILEPGIVPIQIPTAEQNIARVSIVVSQEPVTRGWIPPGAQAIPCPVASDVAVANR